MRLLSNCYQSVIKTGGQNRKTVGMTGFFGFRFLFPLNGSRGFGGDVVNYAVDAGDLVYYAV